MAHAAAAASSAPASAPASAPSPPKDVKGFVDMGNEWGKLDDEAPFTVKFPSPDTAARASLLSLSRAIDSGAVTSVKASHKPLDWLDSFSASTMSVHGPAARETARGTPNFTIVEVDISLRGSTPCKLVVCGPFRPLRHVGAPFDLVDPLKARYMSSPYWSVGTIEKKGTSSRFDNVQPVSYAYDVAKKGLGFSRVLPVDAAVMLYLTFKAKGAYRFREEWLLGASRVGAYKVKTSKGNDAMQKLFNDGTVITGDHIQKLIHDAALAKNSHRVVAAGRALDQLWNHHCCDGHTPTWKAEELRISVGLHAHGCDGEQPWFDLTTTKKWKKIDPAADLGELPRPTIHVHLVKVMHGGAACGAADGQSDGIELGPTGSGRFHVSEVVIYFEKLS